jgi:ATP-dependent helicase HrpA
MVDARIDELKALLPRCLTHDWVRLGSRLVRLLRDHHHPDRHDAVLERLLVQARQSAELRELRRVHVPAVHYPPDLPITARKDDIIAAIRAHQVVVIAGETGSGKTTQIPKMCLEAGLGIEAKIGCTQPRRVAALSISQRIAEELGVNWGREVGCKIRFDDRSSPETYIKLMTDGILLAETQGDPDLSDYNALIIDEAHERSLNIDFLLGYLKGLLKRRADLKLIVTSATIDTTAFSRHFDNAPIIEVSGRMFPVEVVYAPFGPGRTGENEDDAGEGDLNFVEAAARAVERILYESSDGDVLIFMPGERDIRETGDLLEGRFGGDAEIIPLYGRLSAGDQQRVFAPSSRRKVIIATNIAETSLTIPGIRFVVDAGLARISRYNPRTRTKRLPVEPVSQSSANQRKGRAGRVSEGVCIRLYSEEDFNARPPYTQPEIQRSNLAEVILRMMAFRLGDIESFPFVNPPTPAAIASGFVLLQELGALDERREMTPLGQQLARLPIDPTLGRMLLQSQHEHATRELLIIAAGLSIQDPRERPLDQREAADAAHKRFSNPQSDFLALLNIWDAVHDQWESIRTQGARRKFCRQHFLSYTRMREWQDLHAQLHGALENVATVKLNESNADYAAIHRSILTGLLGHVARHEERNLFKTSGNRMLNVFPGSALFERGERPVKGRQAKPEKNAPPKPKSSQPEWIVAGEIVETSQLFARTLAGIDPEWIAELAPHLCKVTLLNPQWSATAGRVLAEEVTTLHGLEVRRRKVAFGNLYPKEATAIFIRAALVEEELIAGAGRDQDDEPDARDVRTEMRRSLLNPAARGATPFPVQYRFLENNRAVRQKIENWQTRVRRYDLGDLDEALYQFYAQRIENVSSRDELNRFLHDSKAAATLFAEEKDLVGDLALHYDAQAFPDQVAVGGQPVALSYAYAPGEDWDGVTIKVPAELVRSTPGASLEWSVPGLRSEQVTELLGSLPKALRRELQPFGPKVAEIVRDLPVGAGSLPQALSRFIQERYALVVPVTAWRPEALPAHLRPRYELVGTDRKTIVAGRDLAELRDQVAKAALQAPPAAAQNPAWRRAAQQWERPAVTGWTFGDLPERITVSTEGSLPVYAWPGLAVEDGGVCVRLFRSQAAAREASTGGVARLVELALQKDFAWLERDLRALVRHDALYAECGGTLDELRETALLCLKRHVLPEAPPTPLTEAAFRTAVEATRTQLAGLASQIIDRTGMILELRRQVRQRVGAATPSAAPANKPRTLTDLSQLGQKPVAAPANPLATELAALVPRRFLEVTPFARLHHLSRYLKALLLRAERAEANPPKEKERIRQVAPYQEAWQRLQAAPPKSEEGRKAAGEFRWLLEEFKVSVFAQELGTAQPASAKRLDELLTRIRHAG